MTNQVFSLPLRLFESGFFSIQLISFTPLQNIMLPNTNYVFLEYVQNAFSFNLIDLSQLNSFKVTSNEPYAPQFDWIGIETNNWLSNVGFYLMVLIFLVLMTILYLTTLALYSKSDKPPAQTYVMIR